LATRLFGEQSATEVEVLDEVSQSYRNVGVLARATKAAMSEVMFKKKNPIVQKYLQVKVRLRWGLCCTRFYDGN